jgi:hypothetical protein
MSLNKALGIGLAGALALAALGPASAAPVSNAASLKQALPSDTSDVRCRGCGVAAGVGLGLLGAGLVAGYGPWGWGYPGYYPAYAYYPGPYWGPYWGPRRHYWRHRHWRHRHWHR